MGSLVCIRCVWYEYCGFQFWVWWFYDVVVELGDVNVKGRLRLFYGYFLVIEAHGGTWFRTPCPIAYCVRCQRCGCFSVYRF